MRVACLQNKAALGAAIATILLTGCVSQVVQPARDTRLFVVSSGEGFTLSWQSQPKTLYSVWYTDRLEGQGSWRVLPGAERVAGTGRTIEIVDRAATSRRYYRLSVVPTD